MPKTAARTLLSEFLKSRRARLNPTDVGLPEEANDPRRRTLGLRRSEVAKLAGISTEWYTLFEMGRDRAMTQRIVEPIAKALRLNEAEREYVYELVRGNGPRSAIHSELHPSIEYALEHEREAALIVYDPWLTRLRWNAVAAAIFLIGEEVWPQDNVLWRLFMQPKFRTMAGVGWELHTRRNLGLFRSALGRDPLNPDAHRLIETLSALDDFKRLWAEHEVYSFDMYSRDSAATPYEMHHPQFGALLLNVLIVGFPGWPGAHVRYMTPANEVSRRAFLGA